MCGPVIDVPQTVHSVQLQGTISICYRDCRWSGLMVNTEYHSDFFLHKHW